MRSLQAWRRAVGGLVLAAALSVAGCLATEILGKPDLLDFLEPGRTTREQAFLTLGQPSATYENERILAYRLGKDDGGYYLVDRAPGFTSVRYSLVLAFDEAGLLTRHSVVPLKGP